MDDLWLTPVVLRCVLRPGLPGVVRGLLGELWFGGSLRLLAASGSSVSLLGVSSLWSEVAALADFPDVSNLGALSAFQLGFVGGAVSCQVVSGAGVAFVLLLPVLFAASALAGLSYVTLLDVPMSSLDLSLIHI